MHPVLVFVNNHLGHLGLSARKRVWCQSLESAARMLLSFLLARPMLTITPGMLNRRILALPPVMLLSFLLPQPPGMLLSFVRDALPAAILLRLLPPL